MQEFARLFCVENEPCFRCMVMMKTIILLSLASMGLAYGAATLSYPVVDSGQIQCFDNETAIEAPKKGEAFYGQDAQFERNAPSYTDMGNGCVKDNVTGLIWEKGFRVVTFFEALEGAKSCTTGGFNDWRLPTIKEVYSLANFGGRDVGPGSDNKPFINTDYFDFEYGSNGHRVIDTQMISSTIFAGLAMGGVAAYGFNLADGRIKSYGVGSSFTVRYVRGQAYGFNDYVDNGDGTITDKATGLTWSQEDSGKGMNWEAALAYVQELNAKNYLGHSDWRLPNSKELHSIVDINRSPRTTQSPAIDPLFKCSVEKNEAGLDDAPYYWTSTTHDSAGSKKSGFALYIPFGEAMGTSGRGGTPASNWNDVHGAGCQRSAPKQGSMDDWADGDGPQGDAVRIDNYVRVVRG